MTGLPSKWVDVITTGGDLGVATPVGQKILVVPQRTVEILSGSLGD